jgi:excisionase family DNA binding protein
MRKGRLAVDTSALTPEERAYLLGLYFTDGYLERISKFSHALYIGLQVNEEEIANRVSKMLERSGLTPRIYSLRLTKGIILYASAANLVSLLGEKKGVASMGDSPTLEWMVSNGLEIPFIGGLIDGDGSATVKLLSQEGCFFGKMQVQVSFAQISFPFLVDFVHEYVNSLVTGGASLPNDSAKWRRKTGKRVSILARGREALASSGILSWSFKFMRLTKEVEQLRAKIAESKSKYLTLRQLAHRLGVGNSTVWRWCKEGKIKHVYVRSPHAKRRAAHLLVPIEETGRLEARFV